MAKIIQTTFQTDMIPALPGVHDETACLDMTSVTAKDANRRLTRSLRHRLSLEFQFRRRKSLSSSKAHFTHLLQEDPPGSVNPGLDRLRRDSEQFCSLDV